MTRFRFRFFGGGCQGGDAVMAVARRGDVTVIRVIGTVAASREMERTPRSRPGLSEAEW